MKKFLLTLLILLLPSLSQAGGVMMLGGGINPCDQLGLLARETFPLAGTCLGAADWWNNGTVYFNYTTTILQGDASFQVPPPGTTNEAGLEQAFSADEVYIAMMFRPKVAETVIEHYDLAIVTDAAWSKDIGFFLVFNNGTIKFLVGPGAVKLVGSFSFTNDVTYYLKAYLLKGVSTTTGHATFWHSTTGLAGSWTQDGAVTDANITTTPAVLDFPTLTNQTGWGVIDDIRISGSDINY